MFILEPILTQDFDNKTKETVFNTSTKWVAGDIKFIYRVINNCGRETNLLDKLKINLKKVNSNRNKLDRVRSQELFVYFIGKKVTISCEILNRIFMIQAKPSVLLCHYWESPKNRGTLFRVIGSNQVCAIFLFTFALHNYYVDFAPVWFQHWFQHC